MCTIYVCGMWWDGEKGKGLPAGQPTPDSLALTHVRSGDMQRRGFVKVNA